MASLVGNFKYFLAAYLSRPASWRPVYRLIRRQRVRRILEIGIGPGDRAARMIEIARLADSGDPVTYVGVDLFELRTPSDGPGMTLKRAHKRLTRTGARVRLVPGDPFSALARTANELGQVDLVVISADQDPESLARAWFYVPRLLHGRSRVVLEEPLRSSGTTFMRTVLHDELEQLADPRGKRRAA